MQWNFISKQGKCMTCNTFQAFWHRKADMDPSKRKEIKGFPPGMCPIRLLRNLWKSSIFNKFHKIFSKPGGVKKLLENFLGNFLENFLLRKFSTSSPGRRCLKRRCPAPPGAKFASSVLKASRCHSMPKSNPSWTGLLWIAAAFTPAW